MDANNLYDVVDYPSGCHVQTHPSRLAAAAMLRGFEAVPTAGARIVELGCGDGWNLIPIAEAFPDCQCFGIDLARKPIERGRAAIEQLGLRNIRLQCGDVTELVGQLGTVDYIIAHGLYSWVPERVRESILSLCGRMLSDRGLAFISFNALPGSHGRMIVSEMLRRHVVKVAGVEERLRQAQALLGFLYAGTEGAPGLRGVMRSEYERLLKGDPAQLLHDEMAEVNDAFYFSDFMGRASVHGLEFVTNAEVVDSGMSGFSAQVQEVLNGFGDDDLRREQYIDYARLRPFRQVLLCRKGSFRRAQEDATVADHLHVAGTFNPMETALDLRPDVEVEFHGNAGKSIKTHSPAAKAALALLSRSGLHPIPVAGLCRVAVEKLREAGIPAEPHEIRDFLVHSARLGLVTFWFQPPVTAQKPGPLPRASRLARYQAIQGGLTTTAYHQRVDVSDPVLRRMILLMDGERTIEGIIAELREAFGGDPEVVGAEFEAQAFRTLRLLAAGGLLAAGESRSPLETAPAWTGVATSSSPIQSLAQGDEDIAAPKPFPKRAVSGCAGEEG
jgi:SAM-dependent methyltransferase